MSDSSAQTTKEIITRKRVKRTLDDSEKKDQYLIEKKKALKEEVAYELSTYGNDDEKIKQEMIKSDTILGKVANAFTVFYCDETEKNNINYYMTILEIFSRLNPSYKGIYEYFSLILKNDETEGLQILNVLIPLFNTDCPLYKELNTLLYNKRDYHAEFIYQAQVLLQKLNVPTILINNLKTPVKPKIFSNAKNDF